MSENPSASAVTDGQVTFSNSDHLEWNQMKHDMMLNLGLTNNNSEADQTPTPTRFIRNCEEVGLFQDLQNVNPFDEVFKKAVENPTSVSLKVPVTLSDDTLHTPQIDPHLEENSKFSCNTARAISDDYSLNGVITNIEQDRDEGDNPLIIVLESENDERTLNKKKYITNSSQEKIILRHKIQQKVIDAIMQKTSSRLTPIPIHKLIDQEKQEPTKTAENVNESELLRQREANKAAQSRCRKRKQREFEQMNTEIQNLRKENLRLTGMNLYLQETIKRLEADLKASKPSESLGHSTQDNRASSATTPIVYQSNENIQVDPGGVGKQVKINISLKEPNKLPLIAPKTVVVAPKTALPLPMQNSTVVVVCPGYMQPQSLIIPPVPRSSRSVSVDIKSKSNHQKIVPK